MLKILLIEDEFIIARDVKSVLEKDGFSAVDIARDYQSAVSLFSVKDFDVIISDINLNTSIDGIEIISRLGEIKRVPVVYLTAYSDSEIVERAEKTMPFAYILKPYNDNQLKITINLAIVNFEKSASKIEVSVENTLKLDLLTRREKEILIIIASGKISKDIGKALNISPRTVEQHKKNIKKKLGLKTTGELIKFTMSTKLLEVSD